MNAPENAHGLDADPTHRNRRPLVSLIFPAFDERESVDGMLDFYREIRAEYAKFDFEMIVVDDGSTDQTAEALYAGAADGDQVRIISLSRNWGSHAAITAGIENCAGDAAITLSADLQEPLSAIGDFLDEWEAGHDVVWGLRSVRAAKKGANDLLATTFSKVLNTNSVIPTYPKEGPSQILVSRQVMEVIRSMPEANRNVLGMIAWTGFSQGRIYFEQKPRPYGGSKWTRKKKIKLVLDSFVEFSTAPLEWLGTLGFAMGILGGVLILSALVTAFTPASGVAGYCVIAGLVLLTGGLNLFGLRVLGEYVWRGGDDARRRPTYIVREIRDSSDK
ncbi:glycosyltransferase family 2 protein [Arthrobacter cavernae]|uniref:Glycosyltransferase family 2 protein n=1 Tax=Arthrobacter cavernae TaxID=2817681 RepID=A0A939HCW7_9MICC|nr:glycosyltransferase family 2 protein [Arthrobacter cavernae]MBO1266854.1 glycosyltransferase family 2 protein [Arthrobacter cavernae]